MESSPQHEEDAYNELHPYNMMRYREEAMQLKLFIERLAKMDFTVGDSFWIGDYEFTVTNGRP